MSRRILVRRSPIHGTGVFAARDIARGERVVEYKGRITSHADADRMYADGVESGHTFLFTLNDDYLIDANFDGNAARWINHGCTPNCEAVLVDDPKGDPRKARVFIEAIVDIPAGTELTYNYGITLDEPHTPRLKKLWTCLCGSPKCTGTMLQPKR